MHSLPSAARWWAPQYSRVRVGWCLWRNVQYRSGLYQEHLNDIVRWFSMRYLRLRLHQVLPHISFCSYRELSAWKDSPQGLCRMKRPSQSLACLIRCGRFGEHGPQQIYQNLCLIGGPLNLAHQGAKLRHEFSLRTNRLGLKIGHHVISVRIDLISISESKIRDDHVSHGDMTVQISFRDDL